MKTINTVVLLTLCFFSVSLCGNITDAQIKPRVSIEDKINSTIEGIIADLPEILNITLSLPLDDFNLTLTNPSISGIKGLLRPYMLFLLFELRFYFQFVLPILEVDVGYNIDLNLLDIMPIYGNGIARISITDLEIRGSTGLSLSPLGLSNVDVILNLEKTGVSIDGLLYDEKFSAAASSLITSLANSLIVPYLNKNCEEIGKTISDLINNLLTSSTKSEMTFAANAQAPPQELSPEEMTEIFNEIRNKIVNFVYNL